MCTIKMSMTFVVILLVVHSLIPHSGGNERRIERDISRVSCQRPFVQWYTTYGKLTWCEIIKNYYLRCEGDLGSVYLIPYGKIVRGERDDPWSVASNLEDPPLPIRFHQYHDISDLGSAQKYEGEPYLQQRFSPRLMMCYSDPEYLRTEPKEACSFYDLKDHKERLYEQTKVSCYDELDELPEFLKHSTTSMYFRDTSTGSFKESTTNYRDLVVKEENDTEIETGTVDIPPTELSSDGQKRSTRIDQSVEVATESFLSLEELENMTQSSEQLLRSMRKEMQPLTTSAQTLQYLNRILYSVSKSDVKVSHSETNLEAMEQEPMETLIRTTRSILSVDDGSEIESKYPTFSDRGLSLLMKECSIWLYEENCSTERLRRHLIKTTQIEDLIKERDWESALTIDSLSSLQILLVIEKPSISSSPNYDQYKYKCFDCKTKIWGLEIASQTAYKIVHAGVTDPIMAFKKDCKAIHKQSPSCDSSLPGGAMGNIICSEKKLTDDEKTRFKSQSNQIESDVCSIGDIIFRDCTNTRTTYRHYVMAIAAGEMRLFRQAGMMIQVNNNDKDSYSDSPVGCSEDCFQSLSVCAGDEYFCSQFGCNPQQQCVVSYNHRKSKIILIIDSGLEIAVQCVYKLKVKVTFQDEVVVKTSQKKNEVDMYKRMIDTSCEANGVLIRSTEVKLNFAIACSQHICIRGDLVDGKISIQFPLEIRMKSHSLVLKVAIKGLSSPVVIKEHCESREACQMIVCDICWERLLNPHCYRTVDYVVLTLFTLCAAFSISLLALLFYTFERLATFLKHFLILIYKLLKTFWNLLRGAYLMVIRMFSKRLSFRTELIDLEEASREENSKLLEREEGNSGESSFSQRGRISREFWNTTPVRPYKPKPNKSLLVIMIVSLVMARESQQCTVTSTFETQTSHCTYNTDSTLKDCLVTTDMDIQLAGIGVESCLKLKTQSGHDLGFVKISLVEVTESCSLGDTYYVPEVSPKMKSITYCHLSGTCKSDHCEGIKKNSTDMPFDIDELQGTGINGCVRGPGFWGEGCALPGDTCIYYRHYFSNPTERSAKVFRCSKWASVISVQVQIIQEKKDMSISKSIILTNNQDVQIMDGVVMRLKGVTKLSDLRLQKCFVQYEGILYYTPCNERNSLIMGNLGEIQCPSEAAAQKVTLQCKFDDRIFSHFIQENVVKDTTKVISVKKSLKLEDELPTHINDHILSSNQGIPSLDMNPSTIVSVSVTFSNAKVSVASTTGSCLVKFVSLKGCFDCREGSTLTLTSQSESNPLLTSLNCQGSSTQFVSTPAESSHDVHMSFTESKISKNCSYKCGSKEGYIIVTGNLNYVLVSDSFTGDKGFASKSFYSGKLLWNLGWSLFDFDHMYYSIILCVVFLVSIILFFSFFRKVLHEGLIKKTQ